MPEEIAKRIKTLRRKRGTVKASITSFTSVLDRWNESAEHRDIDILQVSLESMQKTFDKFETIQDELEELDEENELNEREPIQLSFNLALARARKYLRENEIKSSSTDSSSGSVAGGGKVSTPYPVSLPKLGLQEFDGTVEGWASYYDIFVSVIDKNKNLPNVAKLQYLRGSLCKKARELIQSLETTDENYAVALELLIKKFKNPRNAMSRHWTILRELPKLSKDTPANLGQLADTFNLHLKALKNLGAPIDEWSVPLNDLILTKISQQTASKFEFTLTDNEMPHYTKLLDYLEKRANAAGFCVAAETHNSSKSNNSTENKNKFYKNSSNNSSSAKNFATTSTAPNKKSKNKCPICTDLHPIYFCEKFKALSTEAKRKVVNEKGLCFNCLKSGHVREKCQNESRCKTCKKGHHSSLCLDSVTEKGAAAFVLNSPTSELMATAAIDVVGKNGTTLTCRALLDTCSTTNFITEQLARKLELKRNKNSQSVNGLNGIETNSKGTILTTIRSKRSGYQRELTFNIVDTISNKIPDQSVDRRKLDIPKNLELADSKFERPGEIDMLLASGVTLSTFCNGQINLSAPNGPELYLQKTLFGWIICGSAPLFDSNPKPTTVASCHLTSVKCDLEKFWSLEECPSIKHRTAEEIFCEEHFKENVTRTENGRYMVAYPFNSKLPELGKSKTMAYKRFLGTKRKLTMNPDLDKKYGEVMQGYIELDHMTVLKPGQETESGFYLPHHSVLKNSLTTALRVVFDGSAKSDTGVSLNETMAVGPTIQADLFTQLLRFRKHSIVMTADIEKLYRQFLVRPEDRKYQRIFWRDSEGNTQVFELNTVTFGLGPSAFLAVRCMHELANDERENFPVGASVVQENFYVDNALFGHENIDDAKIMRDETRELLKRGGLNLYQFASNSPALLEGIPSENIDRHLILGDSRTLNTLGVKWDSHNDCLTYSVTPLNQDFPVTKRMILSEISKIFDPLGLLLPVTTIAKILIQTLWQLKLNWDESLPTNLHTHWLKYRKQLELLNDWTCSRKVLIDDPIKGELHGFCDASQQAYGACIYVRSENAQNQVHVALLCAKSRVAPLKTLSIPRLELCGALLLTNLINNCKLSIDLQIDRTVLWTDSTIVLNWLHTSPAMLKTFVANRVANIQSKTEVNDWRHVPTADNPSDLISRGKMPKELLDSSLWQHGPFWLNQPEENWPKLEILFESGNVPELKKIQCFVSQSYDDSLLEKYSSIFKLQRIIAYCMRVKNPVKNPSKDFLTVTELRNALHLIVRMVQRTAFPEELHNLAKGKPVASTSRLLTLDPFLDNGLIRVGGRLRNAFLPFSQRHPLILPKSHCVTRLLIEAEHRLHDHPGGQATLYALRRRFWILGGRDAVKRVLNSCVPCRKLQPSTQNYLMGDLPASRVTTARPFLRVGVDYCGPFFLKEKKFRNRVQVKAYVSVFVCFTSKAVHLELVTDLSSDLFLAAFRRFIARRGKPADVFSDNATNFVGGKNQLKDLSDMLRDEKHQAKFTEFAASQDINWHFIPPRSPNFGGIWEAAVKSFKKHLWHVVGKDLFTYEEFYTFTSEIEAILNSRPLSPMSSDPNDFLPLTPGHFLIGDSMTSLPEHDFQEVPANRLSRLQLLQRIKQHFWKRWSTEYLSGLTLRPKWAKSHPNLKEGDLVLIKDNNLAPLHWAMGRILHCHPGADGVTRVVTVKTPRNNVKIGVQKIAPLPTE